MGVAACLLWYGKDAVANLTDILVRKGRSAGTKNLIIRVENREFC